MRNMITLLFCCVFFTATGKNATYEKLCAVNKCWAAQQDVAADQLPAYRPMNEKEWISTHLQLVEQTLRSRNTAALQPSQRANRLQCLDHLHQYWQAGNFPINEDYAYRTPIFIDKHDNFCAVGYLVKASGHEAVSRKIAAATNLAYVHDMHYPELAAWASENGFTIDELAWIQPSYPPTGECKPLGRGVDSVVNELFADTVSDRLYVGGSFVNVDSSIVANNVAYVTKPDSNTYVWHSMGAGVNGQVNAIVRYDNKVFVAGAFTMAGGSAAGNVAYWNDTAWHSVGCISGVVNKMVVFNGDLYAAGAFSVCGDTAACNFARWNGSAWVAIPGLAGHINTMQAMDTVLLLGGAFSYDSVAVNAIGWTAAGGYHPFTTAVDNEVKDFGVFADTTYLVCAHTHPTDSTHLWLALQGNNWVPVVSDAYMLNFAGPRSFNTFCANGNRVELGGDFNLVPMASIGASNCFSFYPYYYYGGTNDWFNVDNVVNKMVLFHSELMAGGKFKTGENYYSTVQLNGIAQKHVPTTAVPVLPSGDRQFVVYPNPVDRSATVTVKNNFNATHFVLRDITDKAIAEGKMTNPSGQEITLPALAPGMYLIEVGNDAGVRAVNKLIVQ